MNKPQCPKCLTELNEEFGMVTCSGCGSVLFIDFEGQAQLAVEPTPHFDETQRPEVAHEIPVSPLAGEIEVEASPDGVFEVHDNESEAPVPAASPSQSETSDDALDITSYANSEVSQAKEGPLAYTVHIEGLDSKELRDSLREALSESRFAWDPEGLMATIKEGKLTLKSVKPVKASVLVNRLKRLPLKIWWEQNAVTESDP